MDRSSRFRIPCSRTSTFLNVALVQIQAERDFGLASPG